MISPWLFPRGTRPCLSSPYYVNTHGVSCITLAGTNPTHATREVSVTRVTDHVTTRDTLQCRVQGTSSEWTSDHSVTGLDRVNMLRIVTN